MNKRLLYQLIEGKQEGRKFLAVLIDPDKTSGDSLVRRVDMAVDQKVDFIFVGGSLMTTDLLDKTLETIRQNCQIPIVLFPGSIMQVNEKAHGILLLSLISGRNPELLIGNHVLAAPVLRESQLEILPTGYMLIESGNSTTAAYISNSLPIPSNKPEIAACTAMAGEMLGLKIMYMDAGSGAKNAVNAPMVEAVRKAVEVPLIVGGGIDHPEKVKSAFQAGADLVVIGNAIEKNPGFIMEASAVKQRFTSKGIIN